MKVSEYTLLEEAFSRSFGFMLNRIEEEIGPIENRDYKGNQEYAAERCFNEFLVALEELGVELGDVEAPLKCK